MKRRKVSPEVPQRVERSTHVHGDSCRLITREGGRVVTYTGRTAVIDWLKRVANLAAERRSG